tara:strand:- start:494 stop:727 length:234 start_codon:yes stop_codon:yes gene_type:complete
MDPRKVAFTYTTMEDSPLVSLLSSNDESIGQELVVQINYNHRQWLLINRKFIIELFCKSLDQHFDNLIDDMIKSKEK